jgi:flagellar hook-basal body complex protein FliE
MKEITQIIPQSMPLTPARTSGQEGAKGFMKFLEQAVGDVNNAQIGADRAVEQLQSGQGANLHEVMIAMEEADISLRLMVQMRNKLVESYQEIMRMQV